MYLIKYSYDMIASHNTHNILLAQFEYKVPEFLHVPNRVGHRGKRAHDGRLARDRQAHDDRKTHDGRMVHDRMVMGDDNLALVCIVALDDR